MSSSKTCLQCGSAIPVGAPDGQCPRCMLRAGLGNEPGGRDGGKHFEGDRNLLFGVFAVQLRKVTPQEVMAAAGAWAADAAKDIPTRLREQGILTPPDVEFIARLVDEAVRAHGGDTAATLNTLGGDQVLQATYGNSVDLTQHRLGAAVGSPVYLDGKPLDPDSVPGVQETPGRYTHVSEHARGGMGRVLLVHDGFLGRNVALKELMPGQRPASDPENPSTPVRQYMGFLSRFLQEARITGQLEHPSIVPVYELGHRQDGTLYYTMKLVRGKTLREAIKQSKTVQERLALLAHFVDLCQAIAYAHSRGIIHRDIKPDNVMVGEFGETVALDWGLAKANDREDVHADGLAETIRMLQLGDVDSALKTQYGQVMGTPGYMAPEQALGRMTEVDERSDVYSLGGVLYQMLAGRPPFTGKSVPEILQKVVDDEPEALDPNAVPPELAAICAKAMEKRAEDRYTTASAMADEVRRFQTGAIVQAYSYGFTHHLKRFAARHKAVLTTATAALLAIIALAGYSYVNIRVARDVAESKRVEAEIQREEARKAKSESDKQRDAANAAHAAEKKERERAEQSAYVAGISAAQANFDVHNAASVRHQLMATPPHLRNWEWGYFYKAMDTSLFTLPNVITAMYSADGKQVLTACTDNSAKVWDAETGNLLLSLAGHNANVNDAQYSMDAKRIVTASSDKTAKVWDAESGVELLTLGGDKEEMVLAVFDRDRRRVLTASKKSLRIWDAQTGKELRELSYECQRILNVRFAGDGTMIFAHSNQLREEMNYPEYPWVALEFKVWDGTTGKELFTRSISGATSWTADMSSDGSRVIAATLDDNALDGECATVWSVPNGERLQPLKAQNHGSITGATFSMDGKRIATCNWNGTLKIWNAETGKDLHTLPGHALEVNSAEFRTDNRYVVTASRDTTAKVWDAETGELWQTLAGHARSVRLAMFRPDGKQILTISEDGTAKVWRTNTVKESTPAKLTGIDVGINPNNNSTAAEEPTPTESNAEERTFSPDRTKFVVISKDNKGKICDAATGNELHKFTGDLSNIDRVLFFPNGSRIVITFYENKPTRIWDTQTGQELTSLEAAFSKAGISKGWGEFSPDGNKIAFSVDGVIKVLEANSGAVALTLAGESGVSFSPDGSRIMAGGHHEPTKVWDASNGQQLFTLPSTGEDFHVFFARYFSPDGRRICGTVNGNIGKVWDGFTGKEICTLVGHTDRIIQTSFSRDGARVLTWSPDATMRLWDVETGAELVSLAAPPFFMEVFGATTIGGWAEFSSDGRTILASDTLDSQGLSWSAAPWRPEDWLDDTMRTELVRLALRNAPQIHETTPDRAKGEIEPALDALSAFVAGLAAKDNANARGIEGQGVYFLKAPAATTPSLPIVNEDVVVSVDAQSITSVDTLTKRLIEFIRAVRADASKAHTLTVEIVNRYERDSYTITVPAL